jgi:xylulokinase
MAREAFLGVDVGGTGAKAGVYDAEGRPLGRGRVGYEPRVWADGRVEIPIGKIEEAARLAARRAIREARARVLGLCVSSQGQTFVSLDERGRPLHPAIVWYDGRAKKQAEAFAARGVRLDPISSAAKILWLRERDPARMAKARRHLLLPDYLAFRLAGRAVTDPMTAASSGLSSPGAMEHSPDRLSATGIGADLLASIQWPGAPVGPVLDAPARAWGLPPGATLVTGTNDQLAGAIGAGNVEPGVLSVTTGTCLALVTLAASLPDPVPAGLLNGPFPVKPWRYALPYARTAGILFDWFQRAFCPRLDLDDLDRMAARVAPGAAAPVALPDFEGIVSPEPDPWARGAFLNLGLQHGVPHLFRALRESVAFAFRENVEFLASLGLRPGVIRAIGGGARSPFLLQLQADVLGRPVEVPVATEAATLGAAMLAAAGCGAFPSVADAAKALYRPRRVFEPRAPATAAYEPLYARFLGLRRLVHRGRVIPVGK